MFRRFFWDDMIDHCRYHLVEWNLCCRPLAKGGSLASGKFVFIIGLLWPDGYGGLGSRERTCGGGWW